MGGTFAPQSTLLSIGGHKNAPHMTTEIRTAINIMLNRETVAALPTELASLASAIEKSKYLLRLEKNFDGEGSEPYSQEVWLKAVRFVAEYARWLFDVFGKIMVTPKIYHGPEGSIDIYWENQQFNLLINIPTGDTPATFYGDNYGEQVTEGRFDPENFQQALLPHLSIIS